jgi:hypothetical protein
MKFCVKESKLKKQKKESDIEKFSEPEIASENALLQDFTS